MVDKIHPTVYAYISRRNNNNNNNLINVVQSTIQKITGKIFVQSFTWDRKWCIQAKLILLFKSID